MYVSEAKTKTYVYTLIEWEYDSPVPVRCRVDRRQTYFLSLSLFFFSLFQLDRWGISVEENRRRSRVYLQIRSKVVRERNKVRKQREDTLIITLLPSTVTFLEFFLSIRATNHNNKETTNNNWHGREEMSRLGESSSMTFSFVTSSSPALSDRSQHLRTPVWHRSTVRREEERKQRQSHPDGDENKNMCA